MQKSGAIQPRHYLTCLWPGLSELWWRGRLSALPSALVFAFGLNLLLVMRFLYPEWLTGVLVSMACWIAVFAWIFFVIRSIRELPGLLLPREVSEAPDQFAEAQHAYLTADWAQSEALLMGVLAIEPRDPPALLLLSGIYRHTDRGESAKMLMLELGRLEVADTWLLEVDAEMSRIEASMTMEDGSEPAEATEEAD